ncbi:MAG TPA: zinc ribbon domain-containing protein [Gemmatimonadales bacterium]|nr:zinc ribbon domain-containing protein [Gemmatimonadales bacterium]
MTDLERLFSHLVRTLAAADPARLTAPLSIADIQFGIIPYRTHRRALAIDSSEDYEALLLRLCAGEGGLAHTEPPELQARFGQEVHSSNPDLRLLREHGDALVSLSSVAVRRVLTADPHDGYAPPPPPQPPQPVERVANPDATPVETLRPDGLHTAHPVDLALEGERRLELELPADGEMLPLDEVRAGTPELDGAAAADAADAGPMCLYCGGTLPVGRQVNFCPHCGQSQTALRCPECQNEVELGWRHCVSCGAPIETR